MGEGVTNQQVDSTIYCDTFPYKDNDKEPYTGTPQDMLWYLYEEMSSERTTHNERVLRQEIAEYVESRLEDNPGLFVEELMSLSDSDRAQLSEYPEIAVGRYLGMVEFLQTTVNQAGDVDRTLFYGEKRFRTRGNIAEFIEAGLSEYWAKLLNETTRRDYTQMREARQVLVALMVSDRIPDEQKQRIRRAMLEALSNVVRTKLTSDDEDSRFVGMCIMDHLVGSTPYFSPEEFSIVLSNRLYEQVLHSYSFQELIAVLLRYQSVIENLGWEAHNGSKSGNTNAVLIARYDHPNTIGAVKSRLDTIVEGAHRVPLLRFVLGYRESDQEHDEGLKEQEKHREELVAVAEEVLGKDWCAMFGLCTSSN